LSGGSSSGNNMVVSGYVTAGAGHIQGAQHAQERLEKQINKLDYIYEQLGLQFEDQFKEELEQKLNKLEEDMDFYRAKVSTCVENSLENFRVKAVSSAPVSATSSRGNSPESVS
jgi:archaellum component FlaC